MFSIRNSSHLQALLIYLQQMTNGSYNMSDIEGLMLNVSSLTHHEAVDCGYMESAARIYGEEYHPYLAIIVCVFGTMANLFNIIVLTRKVMASAPINRILTALAVADMMLMLEYIPFAYYYFFILPQKMDFPYAGAVYMLAHAHFTQILHTISICLTLMLAVWRYLAIGFPSERHILCTPYRCTLGIALSYSLPVLFCAPTYLTMTITEQKIQEDKEYLLYHVDMSDIIRNDPTMLTLNFWIYSVLIKLLPCCILTVITCWLIRTLFKAKRRKQILREYDFLPLNKPETTKAERRADRTTKMLVVVLFLFLLTEFPQGIFLFVIGIQGKDLYKSCYQVYGDLLDMLALINGAINFILYCYMNRMFRATFGQLFRQKVLGRWASPPPQQPSEIQTTTISKCPTATTSVL